MWWKAVMKWVRTMGQNVQNVMKCDERIWRSELDRGVRFCIKKEDRIAETVWSWSPLDLDQGWTLRKKKEKEEKEGRERIEENRKNNQFQNENWDYRTEKSRNRQRGVAPQPKWDTRSRNLFEWILWVLPSPGGIGSCYCWKTVTRGNPIIDWTRTQHRCN